jgi:uncharacterized protein YkwD
VLVRPRLGRSGVLAATAVVSLVAAPQAFASPRAHEATCAAQDDAAAPAATKLAAMHCLVNQARGQRGLPLLRDSLQLDRSSRLRASAIRRCAEFSHTPCGQSFMGVFAQVGYPRSAAVGENLFWGSAALGSARSAFQAWLGSPHHRHILFIRGWRGLGLGIVQAGQLFGAAQVSVWVAQFGSR